MSVTDELMQEYREGNIAKKVFLIVIGIVFGFVMAVLLLLSKLLHVTYNTVNVVVYYCLIPLSWAVLLDRGLALPYTVTGVYIGVWIGIALMTFGRFQAWCDVVFKKSVDFLLWFKRMRWNYHVASVIICVIVPALIYAGLIMLNCS